MYKLFRLHKWNSPTQNMSQNSEPFHQKTMMIDKFFLGFQGLNMMKMTIQYTGKENNHKLLVKTQRGGETSKKSIKIQRTIVQEAW